MTGSNREDTGLPPKNWSRRSESPSVDFTKEGPHEEAMDRRPDRATAARRRPRSGEGTDRPGLRGELAPRVWLGHEPQPRRLLDRDAQRTCCPPSGFFGAGLTS